MSSHFLQSVILLAILFFNNGETAAIKGVGTDKVAASVHVRNGLPVKSGAMRIECSFHGKSLGIHDLGVGEDYSWTVEEEKALYFCKAIWGTKMGSFHAFQPRRDANHATVFWLVKQNGFFLSWDNSTWIQRSPWDTE
ncbi:hypothetical protein ACOSP7_006540 [Xanthoceras sorbifolium]